MPAGEEEDCQWRGHSLGYAEPGIRELLRASQAVPQQVQRGRQFIYYYYYLQEKNGMKVRQDGAAVLTFGFLN